MAPEILYQDSSVLVINKPSGWIVNDAETTKGQPTVQKWIMDNGKWSIAANRELRSGIVHRLDKETSGCLIIAKTVQAFAELQRQFKHREIKKEYSALVHGQLKEKEGEVDATVGRLPWRKDRFGVMSGGRDASTKYKVIKEFEKDKEKYSLVSFLPKTGRTHQIRIHAKYLGHPLVADEFYAGRKTARRDRKWCPRLFLHASKILFTHPNSGKKVEVLSPLASDLEKVLESFHQTL